MAVTPITALFGKLPIGGKASRASNTQGRLIPRKVRFDWSDTPVDWIPDHPFASHFINEINLLLPAGEFWFCRLYNQALPLITDDKLRDDVQMFIRQEAMHARAHGGAIVEYLNKRGIETETNTRQEDWLFEHLLGDTFMGRELKSEWAKRRWLVFRLGIIAAIEHMTCVLGKYILENKAWDGVGADPTLLDLLRWHGAEEVEHRCVSFDLYRHLGGDYASRYYLSMIAVPVVYGLWVHGAAHIMKQDPRFAAKRPSVFRPWIWLEWQRQSKTGMLPALPGLVLKQLPFFNPWYNPVNEANTEDALRYLEGSPAAAAAAAAMRERDRSVA
jgi:predicted metal-dependent hydrolase